MRYLKVFVSLTEPDNTLGPVLCACVFLKANSPGNKKFGIVFFDFQRNLFCYSNRLKQIVDFVMHFYSYLGIILHYLI